MAKTAKKEKSLTPEEKLAQALVPDVEQPYRVPENWCWTTVGALNNYVGNSVDPLKKPDSAFELYSVPSSAEDYPEIIEGKEIGSTKQSVKKGDVLLCKINPRINRVWYVAQHTGNQLIASSEWIVVRNVQINSKYLMWCMRSGYFREYMLSNVSGVGGSLMRAQPKYVRSYPIPLPPVAEQQRIVDRVESLFAKLDEAKEKAQAVVDGSEDRKAAILHKAFTGELTAEWREENKITFSSWVKVKMQDVCEKITCGKTPKEHIATEGEVPFLKVYNIVNNKVDFETTPQYIPFAIHKGRLYSSILKPNDVIMNIVGPPLRKIAIIPNTYKEWNMNQAIVRFRPKEGLDYRYLYYSLVNPETLDDVIRATKGVVGQANISVSQSRNLEIMLPSTEEQQEVVRLLELLTEKEQHAKEAAEQVIDQIDAMKKSILARAFRGELGTNDPNDESAEELLKRILQ